MTSDSVPVSRRYRFGPYTFDTSRGLLWREGLRIALTPKTADVLRVLIERRGDLVEKSDLMRSVWPNTFVEENNLARHVSTLRKILRERRGQHDIISTIPGRGYMFVATVVEVEPGPDEAEPAAGAGARADASDAPGGSGTPVPSPPDSLTVRRQRPFEYVAAAVLLTAAAGVLLISMAESGRVDRRTLDVRQVTFEGQLQRDPAWAPDGTAIVYAADRSGNLDLYRQATTDPTPIRLTDDPSDDSQPHWSPDGRWIAFRSERQGGGVFVLPAAGGEPRRVADGGFHPRWSPDGSRLLLTDTAGAGVSAFRVVALTGGDVRIVRPDVVDGFRAAFANWHPDGRRISVGGRRGSDPWAFVTVAVDGGHAIASQLPADFVARIDDRNNRLGQFLWTRSGTQLYIEGRIDGAYSIWRVRVDPRTLAWGAEPERLYNGPGSPGALALSSDGRRLAFTVRNERTRVWRFPFDPRSGTLVGAPEPLTPGGPGEYDAAAPLDGSKVAYRTLRGKRYELWQRSVDGGSAHLVTSSSDWMPTSPRWSRDGTQLAYLRKVSGRLSEVRPAVAIHTSGGSERLLNLPGDTEVVPDDWSSDNAWLLGACRRPGQPMGTCLLPVGSSGTGAVADVRLVAADASRSLLCQRFSPDERWISFMALDWKRRDVTTIYVMPSGGGPWIQITGGRYYDDKPRWSPDGSAVYFLSARDGALNVWGQRFDGQAGAIVGEPFRVTSFSGGERGLPRDLGKVEIAIASNQLFLPITEASGAVWMLDGLDPGR